MFNTSIKPELIPLNIPHPDRHRRPPLYRANPVGVITYSVARLALTSTLATTLLMTLADTRNPVLYFFASLVKRTQDPVGHVAISASLLCPKMSAVSVWNYSSPCLFTGPWGGDDGDADGEEDEEGLENIDRVLLIPPGEMGKSRGVGYKQVFERKRDRLLYLTV